MPPLFDHEKLHVYQACLEFSVIVAGILDELRGRHPHLRDQLARASLSVPLNIAEGNGKLSVFDCRRFFEIARGSAMECAATLDVIGVYRACPRETIDQAKALLVRIVAMLSRMTEARQSGVSEAEGEYGRASKGNRNDKYDCENKSDYDYDYEHEHERIDQGRA